ncbi:MAG: hypothetical protein JWM11_3801 [Planctomycetaceae bacterium]|nr:hypothetical protein [Planctomycetaceae bacterium]
MNSLHPQSSLAATWISELQGLKASLIQDPANALAWRWRVRCKILKYLISRYGCEPGLHFRDPDEALDLTFANRIPGERKNNLVRTGTYIRQVLGRVAEANKYKGKGTGCSRSLAK